MWDFSFFSALEQNNDGKATPGDGLVPAGASAHIDPTKSD
jgi:hypothetical protein